MLNPVDPDHIWLWSDTHYNHKMTVNKGYRPAGFEQLISVNWKALISPSDTVYHLGDIGMGNPVALHKEYIRSMPGSKILIRGNHDHMKTQWYKDNGWNQVHLAAWIETGDHKILLSHEPWDPSWKFTINIHGHLHDNQHRYHDYEHFYQPGLHHLIALELNDYMPTRLSDILSGKVSAHDPSTFPED